MSITSQFNILSLNCYMFPPLISYFGSKIGKEHKRINKLAEVLIKIQNEPDVLTLQELWSKKNKNRLYSKIKHKYPYLLTDNSATCFNLGSGLSIISKYPIEKSKVHHFTHWRGLDEFFANKGFIIAKIRVNETPVYIITTHLQAGAKHDKYLSPYSHMSTQEIRYEQLKEIKKNVEAFIHLDAPNTELKDHIVLLTGDLNIFPEEEEYKFIKLAIPSSKNLAKNNQNIAGTSFDEHGFVKPKMLDHIISMGKCIEGESEIIDAVHYPISDHLAVQGNIKI